METLLASKSINKLLKVLENSTIFIKQGVDVEILVVMLKTIYSDTHQLPCMKLHRFLVLDLGHYVSVTVRYDETVIVVGYIFLLKHIIKYYNLLHFFPLNKLLQYL